MEIRGIKLSVKLPALIVLSVFMSALIIFALGAYMTRKSLRAVEMEASRNSVHAYAHAASFYLAEARSALETAAALPQIAEFASAGLIVPALHGVPANAAMAQRNVAASMLKSSRVFEYIMLLKADGTICLLEPYELQVKALSGNLAFKKWYQEVMSGAKTVISNVEISNTTQRPIITIATPVRNSAGQVIGIWVGGLKLREFSQMGRGEAEAAAPQRYGYITDSRGLIIAHQAKPKYVVDQTDFSSAPPVHAALAGHDGAMQYVSPIEGQEELGSYMPLPGIGWAVVYVVPTQIAFAPLTRLRYATLSTAVIIAIIATIVGLFIVLRQVTKPLGQLTAAAVKMGTGDLSQRVKMTTADEIGQLGAEFNRMAGSLAEKEAQLRVGKERLQFLLSATPAVIYSKKTSGDYGATFISENVKEHFGYEPREFVEDSSFWANHIHPEDAQRIFAGLPLVFEHGHHAREYRFLCKDGTYRWLYDEMKLVQDDAGNPLEIAGYSIDITERKQIEEAKARLASILEATTDFVGFADANDKHILYVNKAGRQMTGIGEDEDVTELKIPDVHPEWANKMLSDEILPAAIRDGVWRGECAFLNRDGREIPVLMVLIAHKAPNGKVDVFSTISRDITEHKRMTEKLRTASIYARSLIEASLDPLVTISLDGKITDVNEATIKVTGVPQEGLIGTDFSNYFTEPEKAREGYQQVFEKGVVIDYPLTIRHRNGNLVDVLYNASVYKDIRDNVVGVFAAARDITESKRVMLDLVETKNYLYNILQSSIKYSVIGMDLNHSILSWNEGARRNYGYTAEEIIGKDAKIIHAPEDIDSGAVERILSTAYEKGMAESEFQRVRKDGTRFPASVVITRRNDASGRPIGYLLMSSDIRDKKEVEERLRYASQYARSLIEASLDPLVTINPDGKITDVNEATIRVTGIAREELIGTEFSNYFTEPDKARVGYREVLEKGFVINYPLTIRHILGTATDVLYNAAIYRNEAGELQGVFAAARDITERKRAEEEIKKLNEELKRYIIQLESANKELEAFSYSVSHDLRAPLRAIDGFSRVILEDCSDKLDDEGKRFLNIIRVSIQKMGQLIDDLLAFSHLGRQEIRVSNIDMGKLARTVFEELKLTAPERRLQFTIKTLPLAKGDQSMIRQTFVNLLSNAIKFTRPKETAMVEVGILSKENENIYYVKDNGVGFDMQYVNKLFGVFQRLHSSEEFEGTGVGLAIVQRIIHRHSGRVWAEGKVNEGTTFYFTLPRKEGKDDER